MNQLTVFNEHAAQISIFVKPIKDIKVTDAPSSVIATGMLREAARLSKGVEDQRKAYVGPLNDQVKLANNYAKQITKDLDDSIVHVKNELRAFEIAAEKVRREKLAALEAERKKKEEEAAVEAARLVAEAAPPEPDWGDMFDTPAAPAPEQELKQAIQKVEHEAKMTTIAHEHKQQVKAATSDKVKGSKKVWKFEITDAALLPRMFLIPDEKAIREFMNLHAANGREMPGVRFFEDVVIAAGRS